jgi:hypothetical protein
MGYSHYWSHEAEIPAETWTKITDDAKQLVTAFRAGLSELEIDHDWIVFNGAPPKDFETFGLSRLPQDTSCKTSHRPYDKLVCAVLSVAKQHYPPLAVGSDALFEGLVIWPDAGKVGVESSRPRGADTVECTADNQGMADRKAAAVYQRTPPLIFQNPLRVFRTGGFFFFPASLYQHRNPWSRGRSSPPPARSWRC